MELINNYKTTLNDVSKLREIAIEKYSLEKNVDNILKILQSSPDVKIDLNKYSRFIAYSTEFLAGYCHRLNIISILTNERNILQNNYNSIKNEYNKILIDFSESQDKNLKLTKELSTLTITNIWKKIKYPKIICNIICWFIVKKKNRRHFRNKYMIK